MSSAAHSNQTVADQTADEIRTTVDAVLRACDRLLVSSLNAEQRAGMETIRAACTALGGIGEKEPSVREFNLRDTIESVLSLAGPSVGNPKTELICDYGPGVPTDIRGHASGIYRLLTRLVVTGARLPDTSEVHVRVASRPDTGGHRFRIAVTALGAAAVPDDGLICDTSRELARALGGKIWQENGRDATVHFSFHGQPTSDAAEEFDSSGAGRVCVEVHSTALKAVLERDLASWGFAPVASGQSCDFVVADSDHERAAFFLVPVVGLARPDDRKRPEGRIATLPKPVHRGLLRDAALRAASRGRRAYDGRRTRYEATPPTDRPKKLLLVEDNLINRRVIQRLLDQLGHKVDTAENGLDAVNMATSTHYDLIFMDIQMPVMDGFEATRRIRSQVGINRQPWIIALTAGVEPEDRAACEDAGADAFLGKPVRADELQAAIRKAGDRSDRTDRPPTTRRHPA